jgi:hypothetical protein
MALGTLMTFSINPLQQQIQQNAFAQDDESETDKNIRDSRIRTARKMSRDM